MSLYTDKFTFYRKKVNLYVKWYNSLTNIATSPMFSPKILEFWGPNNFNMKKIFFKVDFTLYIMNLYFSNQFIIKWRKKSNFEKKFLNQQTTSDKIWILIFTFQNFYPTTLIQPTLIAPSRNHRCIKYTYWIFFLT